MLFRSTAHKLIIFEEASIKESFCSGIKESKELSKKLPNTQESVIRIEFFKVNSRTFTFLSSSKFLFQVTKPLICNGENKIYKRKRFQIDYF